MMGCMSIAGQALGVAKPSEMAVLGSLDECNDTIV